MVRTTPLPTGSSTRRSPTRTVKYAVAAAALTLTACSEPTTSVTVRDPVAQGAVKFWEAGSSVSWNKTARDLLVSRAVTNPILQVRTMTYISVAQYNAVVAAEDAMDGADHPSPAAAAAGASLIIMKAFFPLDASALDAKLAAQRSSTPWAGESNKDFAAGEAIGRAVGSKVLAYAATDN